MFCDIPIQLGLSPSLHFKFYKLYHGLFLAHVSSLLLPLPVLMMIHKNEEKISAKYQHTHTHTNAQFVPATGVWKQLSTGSG